MSESDVSQKVRQIIEATLLPIIQTQQDKIDKLEKLVESLQLRIDGLESQKFERISIKSHTQIVLPTKVDSKPDPTLLKTQQKKLEQNFKQPIQPKKPDNTKAQQIMKKLPEPKEVTTKATQKLQSQPNSAQKITTSRSNKSINPNVKNTLSPDLQKTLTTNKSVDTLPSPQQFLSNLRIEVIDHDGDVNLLQDENPSDEELKNFVQRQSVDNKLELKIEKEEEKISLQIEIRPITKEQWNLVDKYFVEDFIELENKWESMKAMIHVFLLILNVNPRQDHFWDDAYTYLRRNHDNFPALLNLIPNLDYYQSQVDEIKDLMTKYPEICNPDTFEDVDPITCAIAYMIEDFYRAIK